MLKVNTFLDHVSISEPGVANMPLLSASRTVSVLLDNNQRVSQKGFGRHQVHVQSVQTDFQNGDYAVNWG